MLRTPTTNRHSDDAPPHPRRPSPRQPCSPAAPTSDAPSSNGLVAVKSPHSAADTISRLESQIRQRNLAVAARIDHAANATKVGKTLRQTEVLIFATRRPVRH